MFRRTSDAMNRERLIRLEPLWTLADEAYPFIPIQEEAPC
jgi:hypothetical protein